MRGAIASAAVQASIPAAVPDMFARAVAQSEASGAPAAAARGMAALTEAQSMVLLVALSVPAGVASLSRASAPRGLWWRWRLSVRKVLRSAQ